MKPSDFTLPDGTARHEHIVKRLIFPFHNQGAVTLGPLGVWYRQERYKLPERLHEAYHWRQQRKWLYVPWYIAWAIQAFIWSVVLRRPADEQPFEREAYRIQYEAERQEKVAKLRGRGVQTKRRLPSPGT